MTGQFVLTAAEMRVAEAGADASLSELMERAGAAVADAVWRYGGGRPTLILCGPGNNGGDGYVAARLLKARGLEVRVAAVREPRAPLAMAARAEWTGQVEALAQADPAPVLVDALVGTGLARALEPEIAGSLIRLSAAAHFTVAVDVPSGVGSDDGSVSGAVGADLTLALGCLKPAHLLQPSAGLCGDVRVADIGASCVGQTRLIGRPALAEPGPGSHKYRRGYVALVNGKRLGPDALVSRRWEDVATDKRIGALLIGPGLGRDDKARGALERVLASAHPLVLDADALMILDPDVVHTLNRPVIVTPHEGEFATLFPNLTGSKLERARAAAASVNAVLILKGSDTVVAAPDGRAAIAARTPGWLASAGTGDVLAGMAAALLAGGRDPFDAACAAVWLHGEAARRAGPGLVADALPKHLAAAIAACL